VVAAAAVVHTALSVEEVEDPKRPGLCFCTIPLFSLKLMLCFSYSCGGVGHLSRDCVQGSKCYNCSGTVRLDRILSECI